MTPKTFIIMGHSGSGKGTQAKLLREYIEKNDANKQDILYIETGARFRDFIEQPGYTNLISKGIMTEGGRQPDFVAIWNWADVLVRDMKENIHLMFDGVARSLPEAQALDTAIGFYGRESTYVLYLKISPEGAKTRAELRGRKYDTKPGEAEAKLKWFNEKVVPSIDFFRNSPRYKFLEIDGEQDIEKVHEQIITSIQW